MKDIKNINTDKLAHSEAQKLRRKFHAELATSYNEEKIRAKLIGANVPEKTERQLLLKNIIKRLDARIEELYRKDRERKKAKEEADRKKYEELDRIASSFPPVLGPKFLSEGNVIRYGEHAWKVISYDPEGDLIIEVLQVPNDIYWQRYLEEGKQYILFEHKHNRGSRSEPMELWEIPGEQMKRDVSQILLYLWSDGPAIDMDF